MKKVYKTEMIRYNELKNDIKNIKMIQKRRKGAGMKIIKRNGSEADFDVQKIIVAIGKANQAVGEEARMTKLQIERIAESVVLSCEQLGRSPSVE